MNTITAISPSTEPSGYHCPENFFVVDPDAPALKDGVLGIQLQRISCLVLAAIDEIEKDEKLIATVLLETIETLVDQVTDLVSHDERARAQARRSQAIAQAEEV
jgi:hypothetical protein